MSIWGDKYIEEGSELAKCYSNTVLSHSDLIWNTYKHGKVQGILVTRTENRSELLLGLT